MTRSALVLIGHGSQRNAHARLPVDTHAESIRRRLLFDAVHVAFLKEEPLLQDILNEVDAEEITIVPFFISKGYYTDQVIPKAMQLDGPVTKHGKQIIRYTEVVGSHPGLADVILHRAREVGADGSETLVVLGHGTERNPDSALNVYAQSDRIKQRKLFAEVLTLFIDQEPNMLTVYERASNSEIIMVPLFAADGWHVSETVPEDLQMTDGRTQRQGKTLRYTPAVGSDPSMVEVILQRVREATAWNSTASS